MLSVAAISSLVTLYLAGTFDDQSKAIPFLVLIIGCGMLLVNSLLKTKNVPPFYLEIDQAKNSLLKAIEEGNVEKAQQFLSQYFQLKEAQWDDQFGDKIATLSTQLGHPIEEKNYAYADALAKIAQAKAQLEKKVGEVKEQVSEVFPDKFMSSMIAYETAYAHFENVFGDVYAECYHKTQQPASSHN
jgi:hypothetical protein